MIQWNDGEVTGDCLIFFRFPLTWMFEGQTDMKYMYKYMKKHASIYDASVQSMKTTWPHEVWYRADGSDGECCSLHLGWNIVEMKG